MGAATVKTTAGTPFMLPSETSFLAFLCRWIDVLGATDWVKLEEKLSLETVLASSKGVVVNLWCHNTITVYKCETPAAGLTSTSPQVKHIPACAVVCFVLFLFFLQRDQELHQTAELSSWMFLTDGCLTPLKLWWITFKDSIYSKLGNIYNIFLFTNSSAASSTWSGFASQSPFFCQNFLHIQNISINFYYLLYNINNKLFAFLLLSAEVLYCNSTQVQGYSIYSLKNIINWEFKSEHREGDFWALQSCWRKEMIDFVGHLDENMKCVHFKFSLDRSCQTSRMEKEVDSLYLLMG